LPKRGPSSGCDGPVPSRTALLYLTHLFTPEIRREVDKLSAMAPEESLEMWLLLDARTPGIDEIRGQYPRCYVFEEEAIMNMPYPKLDGAQLVDHIHFCLLDFYLSHPNYDFYWLIEFDVRYTGEWSSFFNAFRSFDHDLLTSHIRSSSQEPQYYWWNSLNHPTKTVPGEDYLRSLNVICRISNRALKFLHEAQLDGWRGFAEVLFPTLLTTNGFTLLDFGGDSEYTPPGYKNRFYTSYSAPAGTLHRLGTVRWRPSRRKPGIRKNKLYHPVKPQSSGMKPETSLRCFLAWSRALARHLLWRFDLQRRKAAP
jgi:hypothetical protein